MTQDHEYPQAVVDLNASVNAVERESVPEGVFL